MLSKPIRTLMLGLLLVGLYIFGFPTSQALSSTTGTFSDPIAFIDKTSIDLHWDHPLPSYDTYVISRDGQVIFTTGTSVTFFRDTGLVEGQTYTYQIDAFEQDEHKQSSGPKTATAGDIGGDLYQDKIWPADTYYLSNHIDIRPGVTFQIQSSSEVYPTSGQSISDMAGGQLQIIDSTVYANLIVGQAGSTVSDVIFNGGTLFYERSDEFASTNIFTNGARLRIGYHTGSWPTIRSQLFESDSEVWVEGPALATIYQCVFEHAQIEVLNGGTAAIAENVFQNGGGSDKYIPVILVTSNAGGVDVLENHFVDAGIRVDSALGEVLIRNNRMQGSGSQTLVGIDVRGGTPEIRDNLISDYSTAIDYRSYSGDGGTATGNTIAFNSHAIDVRNAATPLVQDNCIAENGYGAYAPYISQAVDMTGNWWGAASGPYHAGTNPDGLGNRVYGDTVDFSGWLTSDNCQAADLAFTDLEAVQVIGSDFDWLSGKLEPLPAAAGRETIVRAYAEALIGTVSDVEGELKAYRDGELLGTLDSANIIHIEPAVEFEVQRGDLKDGAVYFELPAEWTTPGTLTYTVTLNPDGNPVELRTHNNVMNNTVTFNDQVPFRIAYVPILYQPGSGDGVPPPVGKILAGHVFLQSIFPSANVEMGLFPAMTWREQMRGAGEHDEWDRGNELLNILSVMLIQWNLTHPPAERFNQIVGVFPGDPLEMISFANSDPRWALDDQPNMGLGLASYCWASGDCFAHEIGHNLGLHHTNVAGKDCYAPDAESYWDNIYLDNTIATFGYHDLRNELVPATTPDFMSFCENTWISSVHWEKLMAANGVPQPPFDGETSPTAIRSTAETAYLLVRGSTTFEGVTDFLPFWTTPTSSLPVWTPDNGSDYCVRMKDTGGNVIEEKCMDAHFYNHETMGWTIGKHMLAALPVPAARAAEIAEISVFSNDFNTTVAVRQPSAHQPTVDFLSPAPGTVLSDDTEITWSGADADGDPLVYSIFYRPAADAPWNPLVVDIAGDSYLAKLQDLPAGNAAQFKVAASDGYHMVEALSGPITVPERVPSVYLLSPVANENYETTIFLSGHGFHPEDGPMPEAALTWTSDQDGLLGVGSALTVTLSEGNHLVTLTGSHNGQTATEIVSINISKDPMPIIGLQILGPDTAAPGEAVTLQASIDAGTHITYTWDFKDGTIATGKTVTHIFPMYASSYNVTLTAVNTLTLRTAYRTITIDASSLPEKIYLPLVARPQ